MPKTVRVGTTERKTHSVTQNGYGFDIEKCGTGLSAGSWQPVCQLIRPIEWRMRLKRRRRRLDRPSGMLCMCKGFEKYNR